MPPVYALLVLLLVLAIRIASTVLLLPWLLLPCPNVQFHEASGVYEANQVRDTMDVLFQIRGDPLAVTIWLLDFDAPKEHFHR